MKMYIKRRPVQAILILLMVFAVIGTAFLAAKSGKAAASEPVAASAPQAMPVEAVTIKPQKVQIWKNFSGHVVAVDRAEIRPQVSGRITEIKFEDGQHVEKDDVLLVIDPRPYEATLSQAEAALAAAKAQAALAEKEYQRAKSLIKTDAISQSLMDERTNKRDAAAAAVLGAQALVDSAQINLDYANVKAPISGKVSRAELTEGNLVQSGQSAPLLTSIVADEKMYVDFEVDERTYIDSIRKVSQDSEKAVPVRIQLQSGLEYEGKVHSFDNRIDPASGTIRARAVFDNAEGTLLPGMSVTVYMGGAGDKEQLVVSERAIGTDQNRKFVYVIEKGAAAYREVKIGESIAGKRVVLSGLKEGDVVITEGIVRIRPGVPVMAKQETAQISDVTPAAGEEKHGKE